MRRKSVSRLARLLGVVVWPLLTAPAAAAELHRTVPLPAAHGAGVAATPAGDRRARRATAPGRSGATR
jgi:hypothetical protein